MFALTDTRTLSEAGAWLHIRNALTDRPAYWPDKDGNEDKSRPVRIKLMGGDAPTVQRRMAKRAARQLRERGAKTDVAKMTEAEIIGLIEDAPANKAAEAADATLTWENMPGADGKPVEFSRDAALALYEAYPDVLRQVEAVTGDMAAFIEIASRR